MGGVLRYVAQEQKTVDTDGARYLTGVNCMADLAYQSFLATKNLYGKASGTWFYHYTPPGARYAGGGPSDRPGAGGAVLPRLRSADGYAYRPGAPPLPPGGELREAGHRGKTPLHAPDLRADAAGQRPDLPGAWADHPEAVPPEETGQGTPAGGVPQCHAGTELEVSADRGDRGGHGAHRQPGGVPERAAAPGLRCPVGGRPETHHLHHPYGNAVPGRQAPRGKI